jgi:pyruvate kinase
MANALDHLNAGRTRIEWLSQLNTEYTPAKEYRRTSIIGTIGPKTNSAEKINALRRAGLNVVRMNFSHGSYEYHQSVIDNARKAEKEQPGRPLAIALDTVRFKCLICFNFSLCYYRKDLRSERETQRTMMIFPSVRAIS